MGYAPGFSWREIKDERNFREHGIPVRFGVLVFQDSRWLLRHAKTMHGELRFMAIGNVHGRVLSCVFTYEDERRHLISLRPASRKERRYYAAQVDDQ